MQSRLDEALARASPSAGRGFVYPAQRVRAAIECAVAKLVEYEMLEIQQNRADQLTDELLEAVLCASDLQDAVDRARALLIETDVVDEVYGDDEELGAVLREALERASQQAP